MSVNLCDHVGTHHGVLFGIPHDRETTNRISGPATMMTYIVPKKNAVTSFDGFVKTCTSLYIDTHFF